MDKMKYYQGHCTISWFKRRKILTGDKTAHVTNKNANCTTTSILKRKAKNTVVRTNPKSKKETKLIPLKHKNITARSL